MRTVSRNILSPFIILFLMFNASAVANEESVIATATVDRAEANIGDKIRYTIKVDYASGVSVVFPDFGEHLAGFAIKDFGTGEPEKTSNGRIVQEQWYVLDTYLTGSYTIPSATIRYAEHGGKGRGEDSPWRELKTPELHIEVKSIIKEGEDISDIKDIKPPVNIPVSYRKLYVWGGIALGILVCSIIAAWLLSKRKRKGPSAVQLIRSPDEIAYDALNELSRSGLITKGQIKEYYFSLSNIIRHYIENRFQLMAPERTTEEFLKEMASANKLVVKHKQLIKSFLRHCDLVKFARYSPEGHEIKDALDAALQLIDETKELRNSQEGTAKRK